MFFSENEKAHLMEAVVQTRLLQRKYFITEVIDFDFEVVDLVIAGDDLLRESGTAFDPLKDFSEMAREELRTTRQSAANQSAGQIPC